MKSKKSYTFLCGWMKKFFPGMALSILVLGCMSDLGERYSRDGVRAYAFDKGHESVFTNLLQKYVDEESQIRYVNWKDSTADRTELAKILSAIALTDSKVMTDQERKAFYINAYNAMTIDLVLSHYDETLGGAESPYPAQRSIRNIGNLDVQVWDAFKWKVSGKLTSLNELEHQMLRPMGDARIHFAIVCASKGCPPILNRAFVGEDLDLTLDGLADAFVNSGRSTRFDLERNEITTSHILSWFAQDFIDHFGSVKGFFRDYAKIATPAQIEAMTIGYEPYDWLLNESTADALAE